MTRSYIREHLGYRFTTCIDSTEPLAVEHVVRGGALSAERPYLNPVVTALATTETPVTVDR